MRRLLLTFCLILVFHISYGQNYATNDTDWIPKEVAEEQFLDSISRSYTYMYDEDYNRAFTVLRDAIGNTKEYYDNEGIYPPMKILNEFINAANKYTSKFKFCDEKDYEVDNHDCLNKNGNRLVLIILLQDAYDWRAEIKFNKEDYYGSVMDWEQGIRACALINPDNAEGNEAVNRYYYNIGICELRINNLESACKNWSKAGELGYDDAYDMIKKYCSR